MAVHPALYICFLITVTPSLPLIRTGYIHHFIPPVLPLEIQAAGQAGPLYILRKGVSRHGDNGLFPAQIQSDRQSGPPAPVLSPETAGISPCDKYSVSG